MISPLKEYCNNMIGSISPLGNAMPRDRFCRLNLSVSNKELRDKDVTDPDICQNYIDRVLERNNAKVAYGGYLEKRNLYNGKSSFSSEPCPRNIHLGIDFWTTAGTKVISPLNGVVHSFQNNGATGDYGPTMILRHNVKGYVFHTLYGHLSLASIENIRIGQAFKKGAVLGTLGTPDINVNYAPHLHFQIVVDMGGMKGDYPGVCSEDTSEFYTRNCPDPNLLLNF